jgi:hypothetical protein
LALWQHWFQESTTTHSTLLRERTVILRPDFPRGPNASCSQGKPNLLQAQSATVLLHEQLVRTNLTTEVSPSSNRHNLAKTRKAQLHQTVKHSQAPLCSNTIHAPSARDFSFPFRQGPRTWLARSRLKHCHWPGLLSMRLDLGRGMHGLVCCCCGRKAPPWQR